MSLVKMLRDYIERGDGAIARLVSSLAQTPAGEWLVSAGSRSCPDRVLIGGEGRGLSLQRMECHTSCVQSLYYCAAVLGWICPAVSRSPSGDVLGPEFRLSLTPQTPSALRLCRQTDVFAHSELGLVRLLRALWLGGDDREELKRHRRPGGSGGRSVRLALPEDGPRPLPMPETNGSSLRRTDP